MSIQSLILVPDPWFNEPGYEREMGTAAGKLHSDRYNHGAAPHWLAGPLASRRPLTANMAAIAAIGCLALRAHTVRWAMLDMLRSPPAAFALVVRRHFALRKAAILAEMATWLDPKNPHLHLSEAAADDRGLHRQAAGSSRAYGRRGRAAWAGRDYSPGSLVRRDLRSDPRQGAGGVAHGRAGQTAVGRRLAGGGGGRIGGRI